MGYSITDKLKVWRSYVQQVSQRLCCSCNGLWGCNRQCFPISRHRLGDYDIKLWAWRAGIDKSGLYCSLIMRTIKRNVYLRGWPRGTEEQACWGCSPLQIYPSARAFMEFIGVVLQIYQKERGSNTIIRQAA